MKKYVYVMYDPLFEKVICVHEKNNSECKECKKIRKERDKKGMYHLEGHKRLVKP